ncbi:cytochrome c1 [Catenovulum agarivorans DS-2]|uniref:Cytochrome c1 n=1 Tax=Catenovulum agarivorans DS-2 TaxID=1328313 RepID=W7QQX7_9ALTE|nr:cytochrome c1 [Catenovulum agarivorans]EWH10273.1 cytochrome c1 [Catenovulum agarivorans DS-2]
MKKLLIALVALIPSLAIAAGGGYSHPLEKAKIDLEDKASLQRGAALFTNYCLGCHQMQFHRYNRSAQDLGIPEELVKENLIFGDQKVGEQMTNAMPAKESAKWFGKQPPDLTLIARLRSPDWIYTYLKSFYIDESKTFGVNNAVFKDVGMPHVLEPLQGTQTAEFVYTEVHGEKTLSGIKLTQKTEGSMTPEEFDQAMHDLVNFLEYVGEPSKLESHKIGTWVLVFLAVFFVFIYLLKKEYWRDVH